MPQKQLREAAGQHLAASSAKPGGSSPADKGNRLMIISNRLPFTLVHEDSQWKIQPSAGGLITAMGPVLRHRGGVWVGWPGVVDKPAAWDNLQQRIGSLGYQVAPVFLNEEEIALYYQGFSNEVLWPLFHCMPSRCRFKPTYWKSYREVNRKFAQVVQQNMQPNDLLWVHDYQLAHVGYDLKALGVKNPMCYFLHIPFPPDRIFMMMPWNKQLLKALLAYQLLGFQTPWHKTYFLRAVESLIKKTKVSRRGSLYQIEHPEGTTRVGSFPIGIDYQYFVNGTASPEVKKHTNKLRQYSQGRQIILGVDRMDYTKGLRHRLRAFGEMLRKYPDLKGKVSLIQILVPSRQQIAEYEIIKQEVEQLVGKINGEFSRHDWTPVVYHYRSLKHQELLAHYCAANIALITPLDDGMNLVAKEFCACAEKESSVLVLSGFAGAAAQLGQHALIVNPFDIEGMAEILYRACTMPSDERSLRMTHLKKIVETHNVFSWVDNFLEAAQAGNLANYPQNFPSIQDEEDSIWWKGG